MFSFRNDPGADGAGVAFTDAVGPDGGVLDLGGTGPVPAQGWAAVQAALGVPALRVHQVHGDRVVVVGPDTRAPDLAQEQADGLVTAVRGVALAVRVADCLPVLFADTAAGVVGAAHAGRAGLAAGVLPAALAAMDRLGARAPVAWIGPHICAACYEVPAALREEFCALHPAAFAETPRGTPALDLGAAARAQLAGLGCTVVATGECTRTTPSLHSHRRDAARAGRQAGLVWLP